MTTGPAAGPGARAQSSLAALRTALEAARAELRDASLAVAAAEDARDGAVRATHGKGAAQARADADARHTRASDARAAALRKYEAAARAVGERVAAELPPTAEEEVKRLAADRPIVLLPVRIETRFDGNDLLLRIYPDDIFADTHEPELTDVEVDDGESFWRAAWPDEASERLAWLTLVGALGAPRAGWVAEQMRPTNLAQRPGVAPVFPAPTRRTAAWTRAAEARLLPDRWIVALSTAGGTRTVSFGPVREPLALAMSPDPAAPRSALGGLTVDDASRWTLDFASAQAAGMASRIALEGAEVDGLRRVIAFGVKSTLTPDESSAALDSLLESHRHARGVAMVAQGTPTNNTSAAPSPFPPPDADGSLSFASERRAVTPVAGRDGGRLARALGLADAAVEHWSGADGRSDQAAGAMARALWSPTVRYFLEQMMSPVFSTDDIGLAQRFFVSHVRGRGPLPAFRIGNTPYGVLPVSSLARWQGDDRVDPLDRVLPDALRRMLSYWTKRVGDVPRVGRTPGDPDADLLAILGMDASSREVRVRRVLGEDTQWNIFGMMGWPEAWLAWWDAGQQSLMEVMATLGHPDWMTRLGRANFSDDAWPYRFGLVSEDPVAERDVLSPNYIEWIASAGMPQLAAQQFPAGWTRPPQSLLYKMLRHASLLEYHDASFALLERYGALDEGARREREIVGLPGQPAGTNRLERLEARIPALSGGAPLHSFLSNAANSPLLTTMLPQEEVVGFRDAMMVLAPLPTAELERLFTETLDVASHRIDAWITALATKRLDEMRVARPSGSHLGAYGWVEDLARRPANGPAVAMPDGVNAVRQAGNGGFVHAPSLTHAATATVLRNAYLSRSGDGQEPFAVDLSSARVRAARFVLDAVRQGQPIGAVLGYQVERGLHDRSQDAAIDLLRREFPLVAGKSSDPDDLAEPQEQIAARNVVDGLALRTAFRGGQLDAARLGLQGNPARWDAVVAEATSLDATVDAVADLLFAESIYQLVKGSPTAAAATLDAMAQGAVRPPDPELATVPRRGIPVTHRIALVLGDGGAPVPAQWPQQATARAELEPALDAWLARLFGDPTTIVCDVELRPPNGAPVHQAVALSALGLRPIDVTALARAMSEPTPGATRAGASELERRVRDAAYKLQAMATDVDTRISFDRPAAGFDPATDRTFGDVLELARRVEELLRHARPLTPRDLTAEDREDDARSADLLAGDAIARATQLCARLEDALDDIDAPLAAASAAAVGAPLDLSALRDALRALALVGVAGAYPVSSLGDLAELRPPIIAQAASMRDDGRSALARARDVLNEAATAAHAADAAYRVEAARKSVELALGRAVPFLPRFKLRPAGAAAANASETELGNAIAQYADVSFIGDASARNRAVGRFELAAARVRPPLDAWRRLELAAGLLGVGRLPRVAAQLPFDPAARWVGEEFPDRDHPHPPGRVSILLHRAAEPAAADAWSGLFLDQWVEQIPLEREQTGIGFHYDDPGAEAPQAILLAVPPARAERWDLPTLLSILTETLDLAKVRAVDGELLGELGQLLPAIYLADSADPVSITTDFTVSLIQEARTVPFKGGIT